MSADLPTALKSQSFAGGRALGEGCLGGHPGHPLRPPPQLRRCCCQWVQSVLPSDTWRQTRLRDHVVTGRHPMWQGQTASLHDPSPFLMTEILIKCWIAGKLRYK